MKNLNAQDVLNHSFDAKERNDGGVGARNAAHLLNNYKSDLLDSEAHKIAKQIFQSYLKKDRINDAAEFAYVSRSRSLLNEILNRVLENPKISVPTELLDIVDSQTREILIQRIVAEKLTNQEMDGAVYFAQFSNNTNLLNNILAPQALEGKRVSGAQLYHWAKIVREPKLEKQLKRAYFSTVSNVLKSERDRKEVEEALVWLDNNC